MKSDAVTTPHPPSQKGRKKVGEGRERSRESKGMKGKGKLVRGNGQLIKLTKTKYKKIKNSKGEATINIQGKPIHLTVYLSAKTL